MSSKYVVRLLVALELIILGGVIIHAPLTVWLGSIYPQDLILFKVWKEALMGVCLLLICVLVTQRQQWKVLLSDTAMRLAAAFAALHVLLLGWMPQSLAVATAGLLIDLRFILFFVIVYATLKLYPAYRQLFIAVGIGGAVVVLGFAALQITILPADILSHIGYNSNTITPYLTVDLNHEFIRVNSTLRGPNPLGAYAGACLALIAAFVTQQHRKVSRLNVVLLVVLTICGVAALWASYSRSAVVAAVIMFIVVMAAAGVRRISRNWWIGISVVLFAAIGGLIAVRDTAFVSNVVLHQNPAGGSAHKSDDGHVSSLQGGVEMLTTQPLGDGIGSTGSASLRSDQPVIIENHYLFIAHESGWLGLGLFLWLFGLIIVRLWHRRDEWMALGLLASGIGLASIALLLPVWADDTVSIVWWGLAAVALVPAVKGKKNGKKRTHN
jgi:hypothetical protein